MGSQNDVKRIQHYTNRHKILLVGEGDFSFAACLARAFGPHACNLIATSLDSQEVLFVKHPTAVKNLEILRKNGCTIIHKVSSNNMAQHPELKRKFHRVVFNFPHAAFHDKEHDPRQIMRHQDVVRGFLSNARAMLNVREGGEVHITHKTSYPFSAWNVVKLARRAGFGFMEEVKFYLWHYPGYENKRGGDGYGILRSNDTFPVGDGMTYIFGY